MRATRVHAAKGKGMTFIEMVLALFILSTMTMAAWPLAENASRRGRELELQEALRDMRKAIDRFYAAREKEDPRLTEEQRYPRSLEDLVRRRFLRRIPADPLTGDANWILVSTSDRFAVGAPFQTDGRNVFDVRSRSLEGDAHGEPYQAW